MNVRLKFGGQRATARVWPSVPGTELKVGDVLDSASAHFNIDSNDLRVSLNNRTFYGQADRDLHVGEWGAVAGDLIYVSADSPEPSNPQSAAPASSTTEAAPEAPGGPASAPVPDALSSSPSGYATPPTRCRSPCGALGAVLPAACHGLAEELRPATALHCLALAVHALFLDRGFTSGSGGDSLPEGWAAGYGVVRLPMRYRGREDAAVTAMLVRVGPTYISASAQVTFLNGDCCAFPALLTVADFVGERPPGSGSFGFVNERDLTIRLCDELVEKIRQEIHSYYGLVPVGIQRLPNEMQVRLLSFLDATAVCRMETTCRFYHTLGRSAVWRQLMLRDFPREFEWQESKPNVEHDWKLLYRQAREMKQREERRRRQANADYVDMFPHHMHGAPFSNPFPMPRPGLPPGGPPFMHF